MTRVSSGRLSVFGLALVVACAASGVIVRPAVAAVPSVAPVVHRTLPHDPRAFTQGLQFVNGQLYESTGLYGSSSLRRVDLESGTVQTSVALPPAEFGEGLAVVDDRLVQLTWKAGLAHVYDIRTFEVLRSFDYSGEGWGLCFDGKRLVMSDGSSSLFFRDPETFEMLGSVAVSRDGVNVRQLNELECVNGWVYANIWQTKQIVKIDPDTGEVNATIMVDGLLTAEEARAADVLNGVAYLEENQRFYITGKLWPKMFEVDFPANAAPEPSPERAVTSTTSTPGVSATPPNGETSSGAAEGAAVFPTTVPPTTVPTAAAPPAHKPNSGCHCAAAGAGRSQTSMRDWGGGFALVLPLVWRRRRRG